MHLTMIAALLAMIGPFTIDTYLPSFPDIERDFAVSRAVLTQSLGLYLAAFAISTLLWGPLADRIGRRPVMISSLMLYTLASIGCAWSDQIGSFLLFRVLQGLAASGGLIAGRAMIRDAHDARSAHQAMARVTMVFAIAPAIAPMLGGWLHDQWGWHSVFWFLAAFALLLALAIVFVRETLGRQQRQSLQPKRVFAVYAQTLSNPAFLRFVFGMGFAFAGLFLYIVGAPTLIYDFLGLGSHDFSLQFVPMVCGMILGSWVSNRLAVHTAAEKVVSYGFVLMGFAALANLLQACWLPPQPFVAIAPLVLYALGMAISMPALTVLALDCFPDHRGTASSMQGFLQMVISASVASIAVPLLHTKMSDFALGQCVFLLIAMMLWFSQKRTVL